MCTQAFISCSGQSSKCLPPGFSFFFFILSLSCYSAVLWSVAIVAWNEIFTVVLNYIKNGKGKSGSMLILMNTKHKACLLAAMLHHAKWHLLPVSVLKGNLGITLRSSNTSPLLSGLENQCWSVLLLWIQYALLDCQCHVNLVSCCPVSFTVPYQPRCMLGIRQ